MKSGLVKALYLKRIIIITPPNPVMKKALCYLLIMATIACQRKPEATAVEKHLKKAMSAFLYKEVNNDSSRVRFHVKEVVYFKEADFYECEFTVGMQTAAGKDTTGIMKARITRDFAKVTRKL